jgi:hypothetical protein
VLPRLHPASSPSRLQRALLALGALLQGALLAAWAPHQPFHQAVALCLAALVAGWATRSGADAAAPCTEMGIFGGAGMALGGWIDSGFLPPPCLCCLHLTAAGPWQAATLLAGSSAIQLMVGLPLLYRCLRPSPFRGHSLQRGALAACRDGGAMLAGMGLAAWAGSHVLVYVGAWKLELGHLMMVLGMMVGCAAGHGSWARSFRAGDLLDSSL